jgi:rare lipoprotein A
MNGHRTASGERLWNDSLICAHRTHKFGTLLKVRNLRNGKETVVRVIDRGPYIKGHVIDLSIAAARAIGLMGAGVVPVELTVVDKREPDDAPEAAND